MGGAIYEADDEDVNDDMDLELYEQIQDEEINKATRNLLTFSKEFSPENAFFIHPETTSNQKNVLFIHASVNLMK